MDGREHVIVRSNAVPEFTTMLPLDLGVTELAGVIKLRSTGSLPT